MKAIQVYEANDGSRYDDPNKAVERDMLLAEVKEAMAHIGELPKEKGCRFENGDAGYYQRTKEQVAATRAALWALTAPRLKWWLDKQMELHGKTEAEVSEAHPDWFMRMLDGSCRPLENAWARILCIDSQFREWGQPYFANNPGGANICINQPAAEAAQP